MKRFISVLLALTMLMSLLLVAPVQASADITAFNSRLSAFKNQKYSHGSIYQDNPDLTGGYQCFGYANELALYIWGSYPTKSMSAASINRGWNVTYGGNAVDSLCVGDIVRYWYHSIFITGINGDTIYYCHANSPSGTNKVTYDNTISRSTLKSRVSDQLTSPNTTKTGWVAHYANGLYSPDIKEPEIHNHSDSKGIESEHPHMEYVKCSSCGRKAYTGTKKLMFSCAACYPTGNVKLTRTYEKTKGDVTFYRNEVSNATSYTLKVYKDGSLYDTYRMTSDSLSLSGLPSGTYTATLYAKNETTNAERSASCSKFTFVDTYTVSYNANGGSNAPSNQSKIEGSALTLSSTKPVKKGYKFLGWSTGRTSSRAEYQPGDSYRKDAKITFYAVWEPEVYTISFNANGGEGTVDSVYLTYGNKTLMPNNIVRDGYYLKGWSLSQNAADASYQCNKEYTFDQNVTLYAIWGRTNWSGTVAQGFAGGSGTSADPYLISNSAELALLAKKVNAQTSSPKYEYFQMTANIDLGYNEWVPIGIGDTSYQYFNGTFDGNGYTISGLYISSDVYSYVGLFGDAGLIKNLTLTGDIEDIRYTGDEKFYLGGVVASGTAQNVTVKNLNISSIYSATWAYIGNVCGEGRPSNCTVLSSYILGCRADSYIYVGGVSGRSGSISDCTVRNEDVLFEAITTTYDSGSVYLGGIVGYSDGAINRCFVESGRLMNKQSIAGGMMVGGIAGNNIDGSVSGCQVRFTSRDTINYRSQTIPYSIYITSAYGAIFVSGIAQSSKVKDCKYDGASLIADSTMSNLGEPFYYSCSAGGISASVYATTSDSYSTKSCIVNVDGIISAHANKLYCYAGGLMGRSLGFAGVDDDGVYAKNSLILVDKVTALCDAGTKYNSYGHELAGGVAGDVVCHETKFTNVEKCYTSETIDLSATTNAYTAAILKAKDKTKSLSFQTNLLGLNAYQSLNHIKEDGDAVWVLEEGTLPDLYYFRLKNIEILETENGTVTADKAQAVVGETVTLTALPAEGYVLDKITVNGVEISGSTFICQGDSTVHVAFLPQIQEYSVNITADENAAATLTNADAVSLQATGSTSLSANDGEEIQVNAVADSDYTVDSIYVNGEEIAGDSFILTEDSVVTMDVVSISTDVVATTNDAEDVGSYFAVVSGSVLGKDENAVKYIRYWSADNIENIYVTEVENGSGDYTTVLMELKPETTYYYQMTEYGEVKSFATCATPKDVSSPAVPGPVEPGTTEPSLTVTTCQRTETGFSFSINTVEQMTAGTIIIGLYGSDNELLAMEKVNCDGSDVFDVLLPFNASARHAKIFLWNGAAKLQPKGSVEKITIS